MFPWEPRTSKVSTLNPTTGAMTSGPETLNILPVEANPLKPEGSNVGNDMVYVAGTFANSVSAIKVNPTTFAVISNTPVTASVNGGTFIGPSSLASTKLKRTTSIAGAQSG